jgi:hypothetical protein
VPEVKAILPKLLVDLSRKWLGVEPINIERMIQSVTHGDLFCLFGKNPDAFILFLNYATPTQIMSAKIDIAALLENRVFVGQLSASVDRNVLQEVIKRLDGESFAEIVAVKDSLNQLLPVPVVEETAPVLEEVDPHPRSLPATFQYVYVPGIYAAPDTKGCECQAADVASSEASQNDTPSIA